MNNIGPHKLIPDGFTCMIPLNGGPYCGDSITMKNGRMPNNLPMYYEEKCYMYNLEIDQDENWTNINYKFSNEIVNTEDNKI